MCVGVPMQIAGTDAGMAICEGRGRRERIDLALVGRNRRGTWVLAHQGSAMRALTPTSRADDAALDALDAALAGESNVDAYFADLVGREPTLPAHLKGNAR